ncbi:YihY/virulence factor BrkB family protein [Microbacterium sp. W1N]|uniref:YihY/virulence factor BrkB family protein n=1 Tax=Microbacterium festucae TaxID=2977531 RepID=UPI0021C192AC|nr:YihY/virulence factor BrkB family protein [Microbacterium festucae]MCT9818818.1 YihY/virulence factor BrkB family protein [Microbacterium festucae]
MSSPHTKRAVADVARAEEEGLRERWEARQAELRERFDVPLSRATEITRKTLAWFPVRVWRHFLLSNGFLLAASISYQSLFAMFAVLYVAFAGVGVWLGGSETAIESLILLINHYIPGIISANGLVTPDAVTEVARSSTGVLAVTGAIALGVAIWTAIGFVTFTRRAVRDIFGLPFDRRNYFLLKARDFVAAAMFGLALILGAGLGAIAGGALKTLLSVLGVADDTVWSHVSVQVLSIAVGFAINAAALGSLFRFLTGATLPWRRIWPGSLLGGGAISVLQIGAGLLLVYTPSNPLLATFSVFIGFLVWFRLVGIVILVAASWIAVAANDADVPVRVLSERERLQEEHTALLLAARVRLRTAREAHDTAPWFRKWQTARGLREAEDELAQVQAAAPPPVKPHGLLPD